MADAVDLAAGFFGEELDLHHSGRLGSSDERRLATIFNEKPVPLRTWYESPDYMDLAEEPMSAVQFDILKHAEQIYFPDDHLTLARTDLRWRATRFVNFLWIMVGKGGGKDRIAATAQLRIVYLLQCLRNPQRYLGIGGASNIHLLNTASSEGQAEAIFFAELKGLLGHSPYFNRQGVKPVSREIKYPGGIVAVSGNSKEESQEGMNLLFGCLDEIDAFRTKEEREKTARTQRGAALNADGIFEMMQTSASSRFPMNFKVMGLSWPRFVGSFIWTKVKAGLSDNEVKGRRSRIYVVNGVPTWEANPTKTKEMYASDYDENPELARAKYECLPPMAEHPYVVEQHLVDEHMQPVHPYGGARPLSITYRYGEPSEIDRKFMSAEIVREELGIAPARGWQADLAFDPDFICHDEYPRAVHIDTALTSDRCGFGMSHVRSVTWHEYTDQESGEKRYVPRPLVTVDLVTYYEAPKAQGDYPRGEIQLRWLRRLVFELLGRGFPIRKVTADGFQSADLIQAFQSWGIESEVFSLDRKMDGYDTAKSVLYGGGLRCYADPLLQFELKQLTIINGKKVDHPPSGSKDVADAWAGSIYQAVELGPGGVGIWTPDESPVSQGSLPSGTLAAARSGPLPAGADRFAGPPRR